MENLSRFPRRPKGRIAVPKSITHSIAKEFYREVVSNFEMEEHHRLILLQACLSLQRAEAARCQVEQDGMTTVCLKTGRLLAHPCASIERENRIVFLRATRELGLDLAAEPTKPNPRQGRAVKFPAS